MPGDLTPEQNYYDRELVFLAAEQRLILQEYGGMQGHIPMNHKYWGNKARARELLNKGAYISDIPQPSPAVVEDKQEESSTLGSGEFKVLSLEDLFK